MRGAVFAAGLLLIASPAFAAHWNADYAHSRLGFSVMWSNEPFMATFQSWKAKIEFDPNDLEHSSADVTVELASEKSGDDEIDGALGGAMGFATAQFPAARFQTRSITHRSGTSYLADGTLSLKGVTQPVSLPFTLTIRGDRAHMVGTAHVSRAAFNVGSGEYAAPTPVAHDVMVNIDLVAVRTR